MKISQKTIIAIIISMFALYSVSAFSQNKKVIKNKNVTVKGNGVIVEKRVSINDFNEIEASSAFEIKYSVGPTTDIRFVGDENLMKYIRVTQKGNKLTIRMDSRVDKNNNRAVGFQFSDDMKVYVSSPSLNSINLSGACEFDTEEDMVIYSPKLYVECNGASQVDIEVEVSQLNFILTGASKAEVEGKALNVKYDVSGASKVDAEELLSQDVTVDASGASKLKIRAINSIKGSLSGASFLNYIGDTEKVNLSTSGSASYRNQIISDKVRRKMRTTTGSVIETKDGKVIKGASVEIR